MVPAPFSPTPHPDINGMLDELLTEARKILSSELLGLYFCGSLALGDFDPRRSDIDLVIVTRESLNEGLFLELRDMHACLAAFSPWAARTDAVYIPVQALREGAPAGATYPVLESGRALSMELLEEGWNVQRYTLREHGGAVVGPAPRTLLGVVNPDDMRREGLFIAAMWQEEARTDPTWLDWLRVRENQAFVVLTLCRLLYTLETGAVASKPGAGRWAQQALEPRWSPLIDRAATEYPVSGEISAREEEESVALIQYTVERFRQWEASASQ